MRMPTQEGQPPSPRVQLILRERGRDHDAGEAAGQQREDLAEALPARHRGALLRRRGFEQVGGRGPDFPAAGEPLNQPRHHQKDRRGDPDLRVGRRQTHHRRADRHQHQRQRHRRAPARPVGIGADDRGAERPREEAHAERRERAQQPPELRLAGKERAADHHREEREGEEVVELEPVADDDRDDGLARESGRWRGRHE